LNFLGEGSLIKSTAGWLGVLMVIYATASHGAVAPRAAGDVRFEIRDATGAPVAGAVVSTEAHWLDSNKQSAGSSQFRPMTRPDGPRVGASSQSGQLTVPAASLFSRRQAESAKTTILVVNEKRRLGAFVEASPDEIAQPITVSLEAMCFVHAKVDSPDMEQDGHVMKKTIVSVSRGRVHTPLVQSLSDHARFGMLLPPGEYQLLVSASSVDGATYTAETLPI
jgi:hypothetical protein